MQTSYSKEKIYETLLVISAGFLFLWGVFYLGKGYKWASYIPHGIFCLIVLSMAIKPIGKYITIGWYKLSEAIGFVMQRVLLAVVFYIFLFPIALMAGGSSRKSLKLKRRENSYYDERNVEYDAKSMENIW